MTDPLYDARKELARANRDFYRAFERLDAAAMRGVWLDDPCVKCVHPGGELLVGPARVHASWRAIFAATERIRFDLADLELQVVGELGWVTCVERIRAGEAGDVASDAAATNLFVRRAGAWRMVLHHASPIARRFFGD